MTKKGLEKEEKETGKARAKKIKTEKEEKEEKKEKVQEVKEVKEVKPETKERPKISFEVKKTVLGLKPKPERYFEAVGRRKTSIARVRLYTKPGDFVVNNKLYTVYFPTRPLQKIAEDALQKMKLFGRFRVSVKVSGGGIHSQAEALRHGLARCLIKFNPDFRKRLKRAGFLKRDPRMKERKKPGLKRARRAPQWQKR